MQLRRRSPDFVLFLSVLMLLSVGIVMVFSSSSYYAFRLFNNTYYFLVRQLVWAAIGLAIMFFMMNFDYWRLKKWAGWLLILAFALLAAVLVPGIGVAKLGAQRWLNLGPLSFQPSEFAKLCLVVFTAYGLSRRPEQAQSFRKGMLPYLVIMALAAGLILKQPDLGTAVTLAGTIVVMLFAAGAPMGSLAVMGVLGVGAVGLAIWHEPYRMRRFLAFLDPEKDPSGTGWHILNSLMSLGSGGFLGAGLGHGRHSKYLFLPERQTDFIFAVIGEELGFIGACFVILLFVLFIWRGLKVAITSPDPFGSILAAGIVAGVAIQAIINIGVVTSTLPVTGITLPFISFGGTSLVFTLMGVGILLNISRYITPK
ncbi:putative lipid II flippase FtsW [Desulfotomaculum copahuensis]|uniref:Probable peptidoglycan glycosyltransferase FtsW n=1 Tax=Desulfotomaculum copahuensis TaxID=1838280 RepID=A0A1B7LET2_9FIRM|nr:putative lipid II flippase FtsW [Desulfotomaculum copahuensis]OAT81810.1 stage V sporulation protein E [Desulfotomaculum copahuensis]